MLRGTQDLGEARTTYRVIGGDYGFALSQPNMSQPTMSQPNMSQPTMSQPAITMSQPQMMYHRVSCSQDTGRSYSTSQPTMSPSLESTIDAGRSHSRFQEFVSRSRHMELLEILNELKARLVSVDEKMSHILQSMSNVDHTASVYCSRRLDEIATLLQANQKSSYDSSQVTAINEEIRKQSAKFEDMLQLVLGQSTRMIAASPAAATATSMQYALPKEVVEKCGGLDYDEDSDQSEDAMTLSQYLTRKKPHFNPQDLERKAHTLECPGGSDPESPMSPVCWRLTGDLW